MRVAVLTESAADEAALRILVAGIRGHQDDAVPPFLRRPTGGWSGVMRSIPKVLMHIHYRQEADALAVFLDADDTPPHTLEHEQPGCADPSCRACEVLRLVAHTRTHLTPIADRPAIKVAVGLAVPSIEAWLLCGIDPHVSEATWARKNGSCTYTRQSLKQALYGTVRPALEQEKSHMIEQAQRLVADLDLLRRHFPIGFGLLERGLRGW